MKTNFSFSIASHKDDEELRLIMKSISMPGPISLSFCCEPSYFLAKNIGCIRSETMICRLADSGKLIGFGSRSLLSIYYKGQIKTIWYLHSLRSLREEGCNTLLLRAYKYLSSLPNDSDFNCYLSTILDDNKYAKMILESGRAGMPKYSKIGTISTHLIPLRIKNKARTGVMNVEKYYSENYMSTKKCMNEFNSNHDISLYIDFDELGKENNEYKNFHLSDLYTCNSSNGIVGTLGIWNQQSFKQIIVKKYSRSIKRIRTFLNIYSYIKGLPFLPKEGGFISIIYASFLSVKGNDTQVFESMIKKVIGDYSGSGHDWLALGLNKDSLLDKILTKYSKKQILSSVYFVYWKDDKGTIPEIESFNFDISML